MINKKIITTLTILLINLGAINVAYAAKIGELNFGSKAKYIGEVKNKKAHGIGALQTTDGTNYIGKFKKNVVSGEGILIKLHSNGAVLADLKINENFPQLNKNEIQVALTDFREIWVNLDEVTSQVKDNKGTEGLLKLKVKRQNLKKKFFESSYPEWWKGVLKKANNDEKLLLDEIQIFVGKWKYGIHTENLGNDRTFRRQIVIKKLDQIAEDEKRLVIGVRDIEDKEEKKDDDRADERASYVFDVEQRPFIPTVEEDEKLVLGAESEDNSKPAELSKTYSNGSTFTGIFDDRGLPSTGIWSNYEGKNFEYKNGKKIGEVGAEAEEENSKPAEGSNTYPNGSTFTGIFDNNGRPSTGTYFDAISGKSYEFKDGTEIGEVGGQRGRRGQAEEESTFTNSYLEIKNKNGKFYKANLFSNSLVKSISLSSKEDLSNIVNIIVNDSEINKDLKKLNREAKRLKKKLKKIKSPKKRAKLEKQLDKINEKLESANQASGQASVNASSIEISEEGQSALDTDKAAASAAATKKDSGGGGGGGS